MAALHTKAVNRIACALMISLCAAVASYGQAVSNAKGTKQKVANPLNDLLDEARKDIDAQKFEAALEPLQKVISAKDDFAYAHFQLGYAYIALGRTKEARPEYERALQLDPKMAEAALNLGILLLNEEPSAAVAPLQEAVKLLPTESRPRTLLGLAYERTGDLKNAAAAYQGAIALDANDGETNLHLAQLLIRQDRPADAEARFRAALAAEPQSGAAQLGLANSLEQQKRPEAIDAYRDYLKVH